MSVVGSRQRRASLTMISVLDIKSKSLIPILLVIFVSLQVLLYIFYDFRTSPYAMDFTGYAELIGAVTEGTTSKSQLYFFYSHLPFVGVAYCLTLVGISTFLSLQLTSLLYGALSLIVFASFVRRIICSEKSGSEKRSRLAFVICLLYTIFPSRNFWIASGLRESTIEFSILFLCYLVFFKYGAPNSMGANIKFVMSSSLAMWIGMGSRFSFITLFCLGIGFFALFRLKSILFVFLFAFSFIIAISSSTLIPSFLVKSDTVSVKQPAERIFNIVRALPMHHTISEVRGYGARSDFGLLSCQQSGESYSSPNVHACKFVKSGFKIFNSWFRPLIFLDWSDEFNIFASLENLIWTCLILKVAIARKFHSAFHSELRLIQIQILLFLVVIAQYQGNYGTSFRHKMFLLPLLLIVVFSSRK